METTLHHPGPAARQRITTTQGVSYGRLIRLTPGRPLLADLSEALCSMGVDSGYAEIFGGHLENVSYCVPARSEDPSRIVGFSEKRQCGRSQLVSASATIGRRSDQPYLHCHAFWIDERAQKLAGHLWPETHAGSDPPYAAVYGVSGIQWNSADDPETNMPVFTPTPEKEHPVSTRTQEQPGIPTLVCRIRPNEEIFEAIALISADEGFTQAVVRAGLGSFIGATFIDRDTGQKRTVDGPGTEVVSLAGRVDHTGSEASMQLSATLVDRHGVVHAGELLPGGNRVAVTFELTLQKIN